jgi:hypothetical protein
MRPALAFLAAAVAAVCAATPSRAQNGAQPLSPEAFYGAAVASMRALPQPEYLTYTIEGQGEGLMIQLITRDHLVWLNMGTSNDGEPTPPVLWTLRHRTNDYASVIDDETGRDLVSTRAFFDPTWYGAFRALRDGMLLFQQTDQPVSAYATPTPGPSPDLRTIAVVQVIGSNIYQVEDRGPSVCDNGDVGHALHLTPKDRDKRHQLTDVVVDVRNLHFCTMRFNATQSGFGGSVEEDFANVNGYWLQTGGVIETSIRRLGMMVGHGVWQYRIGNFAFPRTIPGDAFIPPPYQ